MHVRNLNGWAATHDLGIAAALLGQIAHRPELRESAGVCGVVALGINNKLGAEATVSLMSDPLASIELAALCAISPALDDAMHERVEVAASFLDMVRAGMGVGAPMQSGSPTAGAGQSDQSALPVLEIPPEHAIVAVASFLESVIDADPAEAAVELTIIATLVAKNDREFARALKRGQALAKVFVDAIAAVDELGPAIITNAPRTATSLGLIEREAGPDPRQDFSQ